MPNTPRYECRRVACDNVVYDIYDHKLGANKDLIARVFSLDAAETITRLLNREHDRPVH